MLVYLWLEDGRSFNALLVSRGFAQPLTIPPNDDYADLFVRLSRRARERGRRAVGRDVVLQLTLWLMIHSRRSPTRSAAG